MAAPAYQFVSNWRVLGSIDEVFAIVSGSEDLPRWWPAAFLEVLELDPGDERGLGRIVRMETRGWLPYHLHWHLRVDEQDQPQGFGFRVWGDFEGRGAWRLEADGTWTNVSFDWQVRVNKPVVRYLSFLVRPMFASNHRWAMARGEESLRLELARRHAEDEAQRAALVAPGPLLYPWPALAALGALGLLLLRRHGKRKPTAA